MTKPPPLAFWTSLLTWIGAVAALAGLALLLHGATLALVTLAVGFLLLLVIQTRHLIALDDWLNDPRDEHFPDAGGVWGEVFLSLARHLRTDTRQREAAETDLRFLMANPGRVYSLSQLLDQVWGDHVYVEERTVDVHIRRLRMALGNSAEDLIETVRGAGYKMLTQRP